MYTTYGSYMLIKIAINNTNQQIPGKYCDNSQRCFRYLIPVIYAINYYKTFFPNLIAGGLGFVDIVPQVTVIWISMIRRSANGPRLSAQVARYLDVSGETDAEYLWEHEEGLKLKVFALSFIRLYWVV